MSTINAILTKYSADITAAIDDVLSDSPDSMRGVIGYHFGWVDQEFNPVEGYSGKMFRPTVNLLVFEAVTGHHRPGLPVAAAIEIIHNFSLLHDDIEDNDLERRGRPTAWTIWGKPLVINVGDYLYSLAYKAIHQLDPACFSAEQILAVYDIINRACIDLTLGQDLDIRFESLPAVNTKMYLDMVYKKTGALIEAAIVAGATLGTSDQTIIKNYYEFARNIGIAFQVQDDILGIWGDSAQTGKSADNDLYRRKKTLPVIYMLDKTTGARRERLQTIYAQPDPPSGAELTLVRECLAESEARAYTQNMARTYRARAFEALHRVGLQNQAQSELEAVANFLIDRSY